MHFRNKIFIWPDSKQNNLIDAMQYLTKCSLKRLFWETAKCELLATTAADSPQPLLLGRAAKKAPPSQSPPAEQGPNVKIISLVPLLGGKVDAFFLTLICVFGHGGEGGTLQDWYSDTGFGNLNQNSYFFIKKHESLMELHAQSFGGANYLKTNK